MNQNKNNNHNERDERRNNRDDEVVLTREMRSNEIEYSRDLKREAQGGRRRKSHKYKTK